MKPRKQPTGATRAAAGGILADEPRAPRDPFDVACIQAEETLIRTSAAKARADAPELSPTARVEARREYQQKRAQVNAEQAERRKPKVSPAQWKAQVEGALRAMTPEQRELVDEGDWFGRLPLRAQNAVVRLLSEIELEGRDDLYPDEYDFVEGRDEGDYQPAPTHWLAGDGADEFDPMEVDPSW